MLREWLKKVKDDIFLVIIIILFALICFAFGRISAIREGKFPISVESASHIQTDTQVPRGELVGSKNGTVYHYTSCPGAKRIKEENKIFFNSREEAEKAGYRPAANCPGL